MQEQMGLFGKPGTNKSRGAIQSDAWVTGGGRVQRISVLHQRTRQGDEREEGPGSARQRGRTGQAGRQDTAGKLNRVKGRQRKYLVRLIKIMATILHK